MLLARPKKAKKIPGKKTVLLKTVTAINKIDIISKTVCVMKSDIISRPPFLFFAQF